MTLYEIAVPLGALAFAALLVWQTRREARRLDERYAERERRARAQRSRHAD